MIKVSYFPGCTLRTKAKQLDLYARRCAEVLGVELCEIDRGGTRLYPGRDRGLAVLRRRVHKQ